MLPQAQELRDQLRVSEDSDLQTVAESHHVIDDIMALAWCKLRRKEKVRWTNGKVLGIWERACACCYRGPLVFWGAGVGLRDQKDCSVDAIPDWL